VNGHDRGDRGGAERAGRKYSSDRKTKRLLVYQNLFIL
jgi:hypothetical protein